MGRAKKRHCSIIFRIKREHYILMNKDKLSIGAKLLTNEETEVLTKRRTGCKVDI